MALTSLARSHINRLLGRVNLRLETLTAERNEIKRLGMLREQGHFTQPVFPVPCEFNSKEVNVFLREIGSHRRRFEDFIGPSSNNVGYTFDNDYFTSPDVEVLYTFIRKFQPGTIIEVGSGNSTKILRQAIIDARLPTRIISIDPHPRTDIKELADEIYSEPVEAIENLDLFASLGERDVLFIDSSHQIKTGNDNPFLYLNILPMLRPGVLIQIHDIFLPYDYPGEWVIEKRWGFNEQYLVQSLLTFGSMFDVLWAGYHLQRTLPDFGEHFPHLGSRFGTSLWLRKANRVPL